MSDPIRSTGRRGFGFEQKGFQERNLALLLDTLSKKETQKSIEALSKIEKDEWKFMAATATTLNNFVSLGGIEELFSTLKNSINETIKLQIDALLSPLQNELDQGISDLLAPIMPFLTDAINDLSDVINIGFGAIDALLKGDLDQFLIDLKLERQDEVDAFQKAISEDFWGGEFGRMVIEIKYGIDLLALEESAKAGGVYSGQFDDLDFDAINDMLNRAGLLPSPTRPSVQEGF